MKTFTYAERNIYKTVLFAIIYLTFWVIGASWYLGGLNELLNLINSFPSAKLLGFSVGIIVVGPLVIILKLAFKKVCLTIDDDKLIVQKKGRPAEIVPFHEIYEMKVNHDKMNHLQLIDRNGKSLLDVLPAFKNTIIEAIQTELSQYIRFKTSVSIRKILNSSYHSITYKREIK